ncbi:lysylphosphatidylglycerol synthase transmembrane domain-containing protein [Cytobacillus dafuensis]|uniref:Phosphatidylglycerol lysyltransferase n=1 Tax=Cytobacillus dafuensis TaxID=1742359 RepID=A0A5B8Z3Y3_CYTDA|nr:lysylphosphatidylglycerol synthase transmembrane domain-containing protein [Cytobacillus dafuensis]QED46036.1 flippase-like domain-containing protein [Cytobacillus dafuensis]
MKRFFRIGFAVFILILFASLTFQYFDWKQVGKGLLELLKHPYLLVTIWGVYFLSFCLKARAWQLYLNGRVLFSTCLIGILYSLLVNHLLPIKAGDLVRAKILSRDHTVSDEEAFHSVFVLRALDMLCLIAITLIGLLSLKVGFKIPVWSIVAGSVFCILALFVLYKYFPDFLKRNFTLFKKAFSGRNGLAIIILTFLSWVLEGGMLYGTVLVLKGDLSVLESVFANGITIVGQFFQITPGGIGNYESFLVFALSLFGFPLKEGYTIAVITHFMKFLFSYLAGAVVILIFPVSLKTIKEWVRVRGVRGK